MKYSVRLVITSQTDQAELFFDGVARGLVALVIEALRTESNRRERGALWAHRAKGKERS